MFQNRNKNQGKQKKPRVLSIGTRRPVVIALWALLICAFAFAVYKDFTAVDTHTVHETTVVQEEVTDTNAIESFVTNFAKVYYSWEQSADSIERRTENLKYYLTDELQALTRTRCAVMCRRRPLYRTYRFGLWKKLGIKCIKLSIPCRKMS